MGRNEAIDNIRYVQTLQESGKERAQASAGAPRLRRDEILRPYLVLSIVYRHCAHPLQGLHILRRNRETRHDAATPMDLINLRGYAEKQGSVPRI